MSRAGKFIPGGGAKNRTGPIRAPDPKAPAPSDPNAPAAPAKKKAFGKGSLRNPVAKGQRLPIAIMSAFVCCMLVSAGWFFLAYQPAMRDEATYQTLIAKMKADEQQREQQEEQKKKDDEARLAAQRGIFTADTNPTGATITMGDSRGTAPVKFINIIPGNYSLLVHLDGYEDYKQDVVTITADQPTDLGTIALVQMTGNLSLTSPQSEVTYTITGPGGYSHDGDIPDKLEKLPVGDYVVTAKQGGWNLAPLTLTIKDRDNLQKEIKFPYARLSLNSVPSGATVRNGRAVLGQTPLTLNQLHPGDMHLTLDLAPYIIQHLDIHLPDFGNVNKSVTMPQGKDFIAACGMPMVWIADGGGFWAGKYLVRQSDFETVAGYNPSNFRGANLPVESVSWESAMAFIDKLNDSEHKAGKIPQAYHYSLPKESQWEVFNDDANLDSAATSRVTPLSSTQNVGYSEPNKYGLYDTLGNVWEWCLDDYDDKGNHSLRGGTWLSLPENFSGPGTRQGGPPKDAEKFIGFRVVLVPN
jgi:hypothetical protein